MRHVENHVFPGRPGCDPHGAGPPPADLHPHHTPRPGDVEWCPECLRLALMLEREEARAAARMARQPNPVPDPDPSSN